MALVKGTRLGSYEILDLLGAGGMGEVYRARDCKLGREVAIKVLPEYLAKDPRMLSRFEREARLLASLNHPNIAAIYGLDNWEGVLFLVLELVPGATLADKIVAGPLPLHDVLGYAGQIAEALEAAHDNGVIHRDLKPSNIKITAEGRIKVLDFGLAKSTSADSAPRDGSVSPTLADEMTAEGTILGTVAYMSPEQARGTPVDKRSDIWSFGCVVFEMLVGKRPFEGQTTSDKIAAILSRDPDWKLLPKQTPEPIRTMLGRCLQKDPRQRIRDVGDARVIIEEVVAPPKRKPRQAWLLRRTLLISAFLLAAIALVVIWMARRSGAPLPSQKCLVVLPFKDLDGGQQGQLLAIGLSEMVSGRLSKVHGVMVIPPAMVQGLVASGVGLPELAKDLRANLFLNVSLQRSAGNVRAIYSLLSVSSDERGTQIGGGTVTGSSNDVFALGEPLFECLMSDLQLQPATRLESLMLATGFKSADAKDKYLKALAYLQRYENETSVDSAISVLDELNSAEADSPLILATLGRAYLYKYDLTHQLTWADRAIDLCRRAAQSSPAMPEVHVALGLLQTRTGHAAEGIAEFQSALNEQPNWPDAILGLAEAYEATGNFWQAGETYRRAIELQPGFWSGYNKLGNFYVKQGQFQQAVPMYQQVVKLTPDNARGYYNLGVALQQMNRREEARAAYVKSIELRPSGVAFSNLGTLEYSLGRYTQSAEANEKAVELTPNKSTLWANLGDAYRWAPGLRPKATDAYQQAIRLADKELRLNPEDPFVHLTLALCLAKTGNCVEANRHAHQALERNPNDTDNMFQAAVIANICGERQAALNWMRQALQRHYPAATFMQEPELSNLREDNEFREAIAGNPTSHERR